MDDLISLVLIFVFIILPIIQQVLGRRKEQGEVPGEVLDEEPATWEEVPVPRETPTRVSLPSPRPETSEGWSGDWGSWPAPTPEEKSVPRELPRVYQPLEVAERKDLPRRTEVEEAAASLAAMTLTERLRRESVNTRVAPPRKPLALPGFVPILEGKKASSRAARLPLHSVAELRRAVVMTEVLGPPVSMR